ncbi:hypothetical protein CKO31_18005 [Thiohalocapsa halophila]|uniref:Uncharacterized protein n=1 Tax=Thiohalocapsa halophila TaxID=69359 RepID=A0ABS1CKZ8_9GAMM|nr:hypothetical protein [Thiohalocapsa halophila]MBK1632600.1 hypothetical protein [Thiohalocapsa halophila]
MQATPAAAARQRRVQSRIDNADAYGFFNLLTGPELLDDVEALLPEHRERPLISREAADRDAVDVHGAGTLTRRQLSSGGQ